MNTRFDSALWRDARFWLTLIIALFVLLGLHYSLTTPVFEKPDEAQHFFFVREIVEYRGLPVQEPGRHTRWHQEGSQPPLYYLLAAVLTFWADASDWQSFSERNPYAVQGDPLKPGNRNVYLHGAQEAFPWRGTVLALHATRLVSLALGALSLLVTYRLSRVLIPQRVDIAIGAAAIQALMPQFLFIGSSASNDALSALTCGAVLWQSARVARGARAGRDDIVLGGLVGLAALSKLSGALMLLVALLAIAIEERKDLRSIVRRGGTVVLGASAVAGWWYARNWLIYGDVTGLNYMLALVGARDPAPDFWQLLDETEGLRLSFWGLFGWFSILLPAPVYTFFEGLALAAVIGLGWQVVKFVRMQRSNSQSALAVCLLPLTFLLALVGVLRWGTLTPGLQGRLLFPALSAISILLSTGLAAWSVPRVSRWFVGGIAIAVLLIAALVPSQVIAPEYALPPTLAASADALMLKFGEAIELLRVETKTQTAHPNGEFEILFHWQTRQLLDKPYTLYIKVFGEADALIAAADTYPGYGMFPTTEWVPRRVVVDRYRLRISPTTRAPVYAKVVIGWYDGKTGDALLPFDANGRRVVRPVVARMKVVSEKAIALSPSHVLNANLDERIALRGYDLSPTGITLYWQAQTAISADYTVFVHALDRDGKIIVQRDAQPRDGWYPTSAWDAGEVVSDEHSLVWTPQTDKIAVGLYELQPGAPPSAIKPIGKTVLIPLSR